MEENWHDFFIEGSRGEKREREIEKRGGECLQWMPAQRRRGSAMGARSSREEGAQRRRWEERHRRGETKEKSERGRENVHTLFLDGMRARWAHAAAALK